MSKVHAKVLQDLIVQMHLQGVLQEIPALLLVVLHHTGGAGSALREGLANEAMLGESKQLACALLAHW